MIRMSHTAAILLTALFLASPAARAASNSDIRPYDENADAKLELSTALGQAKKEKKPVLVVFGANWCPDCRALARQMSSGRLAEKAARSFVVTKVNIGNWDRNMDIAEQYGNPTRKGIPAVAVVSASGKLIRATAAGELASARDMGEDELLATFEKLAAPAK